MIYMQIQIPMHRSHMLYIIHKVANASKSQMTTKKFSSPIAPPQLDGVITTMTLQLRCPSTGLYLKASGEGLEASLSTNTLSQQSVWSAISTFKLHLATFTQGGKSLCLQIDSSNSSKVVTNSCICTNGDPNCLQDT